MITVSSNSEPVTAAEVREALKKILASHDFHATRRNRQFLSFVVEQALSGNGASLCGRAVALNVFGRPETFDPTTDPIVRVEARKLRKDLEVYYLRSGGDDAVVIDFAKGSYCPIFRRKDLTANNRPRALKPNGVTVCAARNGGQAWSNRLIDALTREAQLEVFVGAAPDDGSLLDSDSVRELGKRNGTRFVLSAEVVADGDGAFLARLHDGASGRHLWSEEFPHNGNGDLSGVVSTIVGTMELSSNGGGARQA